MNSDHFEMWLQNIYETRDEEIPCTECFDLVSHFVDLEISGQDLAASLPQVKQHLNQCPVCHAEYETLRDLRRLEEEGKMPSSGELEGLIH